MDKDVGIVVFLIVILISVASVFIVLDIKNTEIFCVKNGFDGFKENKGFDYCYRELPQGSVEIRYYTSIGGERKFVEEGT